MVRLSNARLPTATSNVLCRRIRLEAVRNDLAGLLADLGALLLTDLASDILTLFPGLVEASVLLYVFEVTREGLYLMILRARSLRCLRSRISCVLRLELCLV